jgi:hypothetical protein
MSDSTAPAPSSPTPAPQSPQFKKAFGCVGAIILLLAIGWLADMAGCDSDLKTNSSSGPGTKAISKAEWRSKVRPYYNPGGGISVTTIANFKALVGEPTRTETVEGTAYWYYECSDGTIQVELVNPNMPGVAGKMLINAINDY